MLDVEEVKRYKNKFDKRIDLLFDSLSYTYDKIRIVREFQWLAIYAFKDDSIAKVRVTYEALLDTKYVTLVKQIREAIKASFECACTIPIEYENPNV